MRLIDAPGYRVHMLVRYKQQAVRFSFQPSRRRSQSGIRRMQRLIEAANREAHEALQFPAGTLPMREDYDAALTLGSCGLPLPDGVTEVLL